MSDNIIQLNEDLIKHNLRSLVRSSVEETLNAPGSVSSRFFNPEDITCFLLIIYKKKDYPAHLFEKYMQMRP